MHRMIGKYVDRETHERFAKSETALKRALELNPDLSSAESLYSHLEVDLGRAEQSMVRLLRRARERSADAESLPGCRMRCRYCGLIQASLAAAKQARRLDPKVRVSAAHTLLHAWRLRRCLEHRAEGIPTCESWHSDARPARRGARITRGWSASPASVVVLCDRAEAPIRNDFEQSRLRIEKVADIADPEGRYYMARHFAYLGDTTRALAMLAGCIDGGSFCVPVLAKDPWLDSVRGTPEFAALLGRAETRHRQAVISFLTAEGDRILGIPHPV